MEAKRFPKISSNSNQNSHLWPKQGWNKDNQSWLDHWGVKEEIILENKDNIKNIDASKLKDKLPDDKELEGKRKPRYYKEVINPNFENQNYRSILTNAKKKMNIAKIRDNSHELQSDVECWSILKTPWTKESITFAILTGLNMKNTFIWIA